MRQLTRGLSISLLFLLTLTATALASNHIGGGLNPGVRIGEWILQNVTALFAPLLGLMALYYLVRRQFTQFLSFAAFAVFVSLFVFAGTEFKEAAVGFARWIIGR